MDALQAAREALRARQGSGARYDAANAPAETLSWARSGTAYFARLLNDLSDRDLDAPSLLPNVSRRRIVAEVGYHARALTRLTEAAAAGVHQPIVPGPVERQAEIAEGETLPARALRGLFRHAAVHLDVEWRDLGAVDWDVRLAPTGSARCGVRETPWLRARLLWLRAVDLGAGGSFLDMPQPMIDRLIGELGAGWTGAPVRLLPSDRAGPVALGTGGDVEVRGASADIARWLAGRGARRLSHDRPLPAIVVFDPSALSQSEDI